MRIALVLWFAASALCAAPRIQVKLSPDTGAAARDGRLIVIVSNAPQGEPRFQVTWGLTSQQIFGRDVDG